MDQMKLYKSYFFWKTGVNTFLWMWDIQMALDI